ncbi:MAG: hypothetical protein ACR2NH_01080 [Solirubrobacteraceae bacterium]
MQELFFVICFSAGVLIVLVCGLMLTQHYRLPWREALMYFGLAPYPGEEQRRPRVS